MSEIGDSICVRIVEHFNKGFCEASDLGTGQQNALQERGFRVVNSGIVLTTYPSQKVYYIVWDDEKAIASIGQA